MNNKDIIEKDVIETAKTVALSLDNFGLAVNINWEVYRDIRYLSSILSASFRLPSESMTTIKISYPSNWWQHLKKDLAPKWFLNRYPVVNETEIIDSRVAYTKISIPNLPNFRYLQRKEF